MSVDSASLIEETEERNRDLDPNVRQRRAADPAHSVWVGASAGTGKTKVLTDRVLRLLLPRHDGRPGTPAHRILCLTFTKAAASEMLQRINKILGRWAVMDEFELAQNLKQLTGQTPTVESIKAARQLFTTVIDTPGGLKIMTIHSFCQSVLGRFPLEAALSPHFTVIDEGPAGELLSRARDIVLNKARRDPDSDLGQAVRAIAAIQNEDQFAKLLRSLCSERLQLERTAGMDIFEELCSSFALSPDETAQSILAKACADDAFDKAALYSCCKSLATGTEKSDQPKGRIIQNWLESPPEERVAEFELYKSQFLKKSDGLAQKNQATSNLQKRDPACEAIMQAEAQRLFNVSERIKAAQCVAMTCSLVTLGHEIIQEYQLLKDHRGVLDYDDLILRTKALLDNSDMAPWVLYKLDGGLDHILIDEAQDTNPEQWQIVSRLCEDFFSGSGARDDVTRTVFTVGDEKQSIYSFQRAAPQEFERMRAHFAALAQTREEKLAISFRSVESVLALVDETFKPPEMRTGLGPDAIEHHSYRRGQAGLVELWPLFESDPMPEEEPWTPPIRIIETPSGQAKLAEHIGKTIKNWLDTGEIISSLARPIQPGDIMILVRTRTAFVGQIVRALKTRNIPVSGVDRMVLGEQIAVMDLLALAQFALLPDDDLSLACVLKSPFIGLSEDRLYELAVDRSNSLWQALKSSPHREETAWLDEMIHHAAADHPYEFFARILQAPCPADSVSGLRAVMARLGEDALDPLDEFLNAALSYEQDHIPTLQGFLVWQKQGDITIKRELEDAGQAVRIMTVHGSKGLQAPVVILPDTTRTSASKKMDNLLWPDKTGLAVPLWAARNDNFHTLYREARSRCEDYLEEEYRRLLYVAMTRAEDRLYIGGYKGKRQPLEACWYNYIAAAFDRLDNVEEQDGIRRRTNPQTREPDREDHGVQQEKAANMPPPLWLFKKAPEEPDPPRPLVPSRPATPEPAMRSPLDGRAEFRFRRGTITHKLLQWLPDLPPSEWRQAAENFVRQPGHRLPAGLQKDIVNETLGILEHPDYAPLFGPGSMAEVPVTGLISGKLVSAQIDRLLITESKVWIVDYKTNRPPPQNENDIPQIYRDQMASYRDIAAALYPERPIECFLLWTDGPLLMPIRNL